MFRRAGKRAEGSHPFVFSLFTGSVTSVLLTITVRAGLVCKAATQDREVYLPDPAAASDPDNIIPYSILSRGTQGD